MEEYLTGIVCDTTQSPHVPSSSSSRSSKYEKITIDELNTAGMTVRQRTLAKKQRELDSNIELLKKRVRRIASKYRNE